MRKTTRRLFLPSGPLGRLWCVLAALLWLVGSVAASEHLSSVTHILCLEHGLALEDLPAAPPGATRIAGLTVSGVPANPEAHHACGLPPALRNGAPRVISACVFAAAPADDMRVAPPPAIDIRSGPPLLALAPKGSPPFV